MHVMIVAGVPLFFSWAGYLCKYDFFSFFSAVAMLCLLLRHQCLRKRGLGSYYLWVKIVITVVDGFLKKWMEGIRDFYLSSPPPLFLSTHR